MKDDRLYAVHVRESIEKIESYTREGKKTFLADSKTQDAVVRNLQILAESSKRLSDGLKARHAQIDWSSIAGFRNVAVHEYLGIDLGQIWDIVERDLPPLKKAIADILKQLGVT
ncbi:MAG: hypothetical protein A2902_04020 [Elusimicrobia bacterium RIFCSPLOWO2_01_FULL_64_13]|nr:MAG: hypothetical protein A2636_00040 [Elusimicrobia bacterium RIFCSPHIGHO2_01_FULL_64_10]OGR96025.1 MAG: hypothetical protein A2902_04020 [Elusimicrobia bacterium RIFCSPLOWO2_01_FULL_64_13]